MEENPYVALMSLMRGAAEETAQASLCMGVVTSAEPLKILVGGNTLERGELLCNAELKDAMEVEVELEGDLTVSGPGGSISGGMRLKGEGQLKRKKAFQAGERLLLLPIEESQRYIILCKVVAL